MTDLIILATLLSGPRHGYYIKRQAGLILGQQLLHNNLVYPLLRRFMARKWVRRRTLPGERGQMRQQYTLTTLGRKELISRLGSFTEQDARAADAFRLRVGMFQLLKRNIREHILETRAQFLNTRLEKLATIRGTFKLDRYAAEVTSRLCGDCKSELEWIRHLRRVST
jgi:DNA-binding PadR family transcriptional regulator